MVMQHVCELPQASVALKQTCEVPTGKAVPLAPPLVRVTVAPPAGHVVVAVGIAFAGLQQAMPNQDATFDGIAQVARERNWRIDPRMRQLGHLHQFPEQSVARARVTALTPPTYSHGRHSRPIFTFIFYFLNNKS